MNAETQVRWPWILTGVALVAALAVFLIAPDMTTRSQLGDYLSGFASTIAFIWLIAAYLQQGHDLRLQRHELSLQREALDLQREELKKLGKYAGLEQVAHLLEQFDESLRNNPNSPAKSSSELSTAFTNGMSLWKTLLESKDPNAAFDAYGKWMAIYSPCLAFVARVASAIDLYCEASGEAPIYPGHPPAERVYFGHDRIKTIPHVCNYADSAYAISSSLVITAPGLDRLQLAGLEATEKLMPGVVKEEALLEFRAKVKAFNGARRAAKADQGA